MSNFNQHFRNVHQPIQIVGCKLCNLEFNINARSSHVHNEHGLSTTDYNNTVIEPHIFAKFPDKRVQCLKCFKPFSKMSNFNQHFRNIHQPYPPKSLFKQETLEYESWICM